MNWLKKQTSKGRQQLAHRSRRHNTTNSTPDHLPYPQPPSLLHNLPPPASPKHKRARSDITVTSPRLSHSRPPPRKRTESFAAHLNEFGNTDDLDNLFADDTLQEEQEQQNQLQAKQDQLQAQAKRQPKGSFATRLNEFVGNDKGDLDDIVNDIGIDVSTSNKQKKQFSTLQRHNHTMPLPVDSYKERFTLFTQNQRVRTGTISKLKKELEQSPNGSLPPPPAKNMNKTKNKYKKRTKMYTESAPTKQSAFPFAEDEDTATTDPPPLIQDKEDTKEAPPTSTSMTDHDGSRSPSSSVDSFTSMISSSKYATVTDEWYKYLVSVHEHLAQHVQYFSMIPAEMTSGNAETDLKHDMERTYTRILITKMKAWIEQYGVVAMNSHHEVFELKKQLIKTHEEANTLEEESVQLTQKVFGMEHQLNSLKDTTKEQTQIIQRQGDQLEVLQQAIRSYKIDIKDLKENVIQLTPRSRPQNGGNKTPPPPQTAVIVNSIPALRLSASADIVPRSPPPPPPPPRTPPRSPPSPNVQSPISLKQSYSENMMLDVADEMEHIQRQKTHPQPVHRLKPSHTASKKTRHSQPNMKLKSNVIEMQNEQLLNQNGYLLDELNCVTKHKSALETQVSVLKTLLSDVLGNVDKENTGLVNGKSKAKAVAASGGKDPKLQTPPLRGNKKRKSLINFKRKSSSKAQPKEDDLLHVLNELRQDKYVWAKEKNELKEQIEQLTQQMRSESKKHRVLDSEDITALKQSSRAVARKEKEEAIARKEKADWKAAGAFHDQLNNFAIDEACDMDDVLNAISHDIKVDRELSEIELSGMEYIGDVVKITHDIVVTAEIDEYENSDDGWVDDHLSSSVSSPNVLSQSTTQPIMTSSVSTTAPLHRKPAKITKVMIPKDKQQQGLNGLLSKIIRPDKKKNVPKKRLPPPPPGKMTKSASATTVIADVKRTKRRFFHPTKHGFMCIAESKLWSTSKPRVYAAIDGLPSSTNLDRTEPNWKKRKAKDTLVPFLCLFAAKKDYEKLISLTAHKTVRDILFQKKFAELCGAAIRLDTAMVHWDANVLKKDLQLEEIEDGGGCKLFVASNVDSECVDIHSFVMESEQDRNQWLAAIQGMIDRRRASAHRRSLHGNTHQNPASGRYKMKLF